MLPKKLHPAKLNILCSNCLSMSFRNLHSLKYFLQYKVYMMLTNKVTKDIKIAYKISLSDAEPFNKKTIANCNITSSILT